MTPIGHLSVQLLIAESNGHRPPCTCWDGKFHRAEADTRELCGLSVPVTGEVLSGVASSSSLLVAQRTDWSGAA